MATVIVTRSTGGTAKNAPLTNAEVDTNFINLQTTADGAVATATKDASGGVPGLTLFKLNLRNAANTITSWFTNAATAARTWTFPDKDGTVAMTSDFAAPGPIGGTTPAAGTFTTLTSTGNATLGDAEATDTHAIKGATTLLANSASAALTVTQTGAGNAFVVEDSASTDATPFVIDASGRTLVGLTAAFPTNYGNTPTALINSNFSVQALGITRFTNDIFGADVDFVKSRSTTAGGHAIVLNNDQISNLVFSGSDGVTFKPAASITTQVDGTPGTNDMPGRLVFSTTADGASSPTERMRIDSDGATTHTANSTSAALTVTQTGAGNAFVVEDSASTDSTPFVIRSDGATTIGSSSSDAKPLNVVGTSDSAAFFRYSADTAGPSLWLQKSRSASLDAHTVVQNGDTIAGFYFTGSDGTGYIRAAQITSSVDGTPNTNDMPGRLVFSTTADGASSPTERMRIDSAGLITACNSTGLGYGAGSGGTVTQATSKSTSVTLNKPSGQITMHNAALASAAQVSFVVNNTLVSTSDLVIVAAVNNGHYRVEAPSIGSGAFSIRITNNTGGSLSEAVGIIFTVIKGSTT